LLPVPDSPPGRSAEVVLSPELDPSAYLFNHHSVPFSSALSIQNLAPSSSDHEIPGSLDTVFSSGLELELLTSSAGDSNSSVSHSVPALGPDVNSIPGMGPDVNSIPGLGPDRISTSDLELIENDSGDNDSIINQPSQSEIVNTEQSGPETLAPSKKSRGKMSMYLTITRSECTQTPLREAKKDQGAQNALDGAGSAMSSSEMTGEEGSANKQKNI